MKTPYLTFKGKTNWSDRPDHRGHGGRSQLGGGIRRRGRGKLTPKHLRPQGKFPPARTFHEAPLRWLLRWWIGWHWRRSRPCPCCSRRGYWYAYGGVWQDIPKRRWLCKWCGYMDSINGQEWCGISRKLTCWVGADSEDGVYTPQTALQNALKELEEADAQAQPATSD